MIEKNSSFFRAIHADLIISSVIPNRSLNTCQYDSEIILFMMLKMNKHIY